MALQPLTQRRMTVVGNKRLLLGTIGRFGGGNCHIQTGLRYIINADVVPLANSGGTGQTVLCKHSTAEGTEEDAKESGFLTIEGTEDLDYCVMVWGW